MKYTDKEKLDFIYSRRKDDNEQQPLVNYNIPETVPTVNSAVTAFPSSAIVAFVGKYEFLHPSYPCRVYYPIIDDRSSDYNVFQSYDYAMQSSRLDSSLSDEDKVKVIKHINQLGHVKDVKTYLNKCDRIVDSTWKSLQSLVVAEKILRDKFIRNDVKASLLNTGNKMLVYMNDINDTYWGVNASGQGRNELGKLMMQIRKDINNGDDLKKWIDSYIHSYCVTSNSSCSKSGSSSISSGVMLHVGISDANGTFERKLINCSNNDYDCGIIFVGKSNSNALIVSNESVSRVHAIVVATADNSLVIVDLSSSNGTFVGSSKVHSFVPTPLHSDTNTSSTVRFGSCSNQYVFTMSTTGTADTGTQDYHKANKLYEKMAADLNHDGVSNDSKKISAQQQVFITNLSYNVMKSDVENFFIKCGEITDVTLPVDRATSVSKGYAIVAFKNLNAVMQALARDGDDFMGRSIKVKKFVEGNHTGSRSSSGSSGSISSRKRGRSR